MPRGRGKNGGNKGVKKRPIERYEHTDKKRVNNPPVGLVTQTPILRFPRTESTITLSRSRL